MIAVIDYGLGNLGSIANMLRVIGEKVVITNSKDLIEKSDGIILPGVGAFDAGVQNLRKSGLDDVIRAYAETGRPILGICLGMQLLGMRSEEGVLDGLGLIPFECRKFPFPKGSELKVPHMGWDIVDIKKQDEPIVSGLTGVQRYYFVHSFYAVCNDQNNVLMTCDYGLSFAAAVINGNVVGVQFHPEKSHDFGLALFSNYVDVCRNYKSCSKDRE